MRRFRKVNESLGGQGHYGSPMWRPRLTADSNDGDSPALGAADFTLLHIANSLVKFQPVAASGLLSPSLHPTMAIRVEWPDDSLHAGKAGAYRADRSRRRAISSKATTATHVPISKHRRRLFVAWDRRRSRTPSRRRHFQMPGSSSLIFASKGRAENREPWSRIPCGRIERGVPSS